MENLHLNGGDVIPVGNNEEMNAIVRKERTWPKGRIPYVIAPSLRNKSEEIKKAMKYIEVRTCIRFVPRTRESNYVYMIKNQSCSSFQGMVGGAQRLSLGNGCYKMGKILHELVHAIGFSHEQSRFDRDEYITIHWENIIPGKLTF
ncbi:Zinc metalloproteinase nas-15, partial [Stegodyphus mimosarum]